MVTSSQTGCRRSQRMLRPPPEREGLCHCPAGWNAPITGRLQATARLENHIFPTIGWERVTLRRPVLRALGGLGGSRGISAVLRPLRPSPTRATETVGSQIGLVVKAGRLSGASPMSLALNQHTGGSGA